MKNFYRILVLGFVFCVGCASRNLDVTQQDEQDVWVIRTDFSDDPQWEAVKKLIAEPQRDPISNQEFVAYVDFVSDQAFRGLEQNSLIKSLPDNYPGFLCLIVDETTLKHSEHPILVVDFAPESDNPADYERKPSQTPDDEIKSFRAIPSTIQAIENNLSIANADFEDFSEYVDEDGIYRGYE